MHGMQPVMGDWQINLLSSIFQRDQLQVTTLTVNLSSSLDIKWEGIGSKGPMSTWQVSEEVLNNINNFKYNKFLDIGK